MLRRDRYILNKARGNSNQGGTAGKIKLVPATNIYVYIFSGRVFYILKK